MKNMKTIIVFVLTVVMAMVFTGCNAIETGEPVNIAFVVGIADGESKVNSGIDELFDLPACPGSDFAFISVEGSPVCIGEPGTMADLSSRGYSNAMMDRIRSGIRAELSTRLDSYRPSSAQIDMAGAIELGVRQLNSQAVDGRKNILVLYCSGRSSAGLIDLVETPAFKVDIEASVATIAQKMGIDMSKVDEVIWYAIGECGGEQPALSSGEKGKLRDFYTQLFIALGMDPDHILFKSNLPSSECYHFEDVPVSCMAVEDTGSGLKELVEVAPEDYDDVGVSVLETADTSVPEVPVAPILAEPIVFPENIVQYLPDSDRFLDPEAAAEAIQPVVDLLLRHPDLEVLLYGTCAGGANSEYTLRLGKARAMSVRDVLVAAGVDESRITVVSVKVEDDPYYQDGLGTGAEASVNRKTVIVDKSSALAEKIFANTQ